MPAENDNKKGNKEEKAEQNPWSPTICLPQTRFPMKADLAKREPEMVEFWQKNRIYARQLRKRREAKAPLFVLHDGPPYANGHFHVGHSLNKILKDIIVKYQSMSGHYAPYVPGWDCHGLPIELAVMKKLANRKKGEDKDPVKIREACREYALEFIKVQARDQSRFGVFWDDSDIESLSLQNQIESENFYYTMSPGYEARILEAFKILFEKEMIYQGLRPIHWCPTDATALAEAEVEYENHVSPAVYVGFPAKNGSADALVVIWTTTPWTLPANLGVCFHPEFKYSVYGSDHGDIIIAEGLADAMAADTGLSLKLKKQLTKAEVEALVVRHPFIDRESRVLFGEHVTLDAGTGIVHTAPGHGHDDYVVGLKYGLKPYAPVDHRGRYTEEFPLMQGTFVFEANDKIIGLLQEKGFLLGHKKIEHSYPHCWRCHKPLIFRATEQWFFALDSLKPAAMENVKKTRWIPAWGENRFSSMVERRPDWCLSRQRFWGVPIPAFRCENCRKTHISAATLSRIIDAVKKEGIEIWTKRSAAELLEDGSVCAHCGSTKLEKQNDILDVWFDSGVSWFAVLDKIPGASRVADFYLEGSDQHRGWFQSSLWPALAIEGRAPYRQVLTHGYVLDEKGRAMSKSLGNVISPVEDIIPKYGADILRLWVSSEDYRTDNTIGFDMLVQIADSYRKIRNTLRYILGNIGDSATPADAGKITVDLDRWVLDELSRLGADVRSAYDNCEFHTVYHRVLQFCTVTLSNTYFDIVRDRLYCDAVPGKKPSAQAASYHAGRESCEATLKILLEHLLLWLAPILSFTAEEVNRLLGSEDSIFERDFSWAEKWRNDKLSSKFETLWRTREEVNGELERLRAAKEIGSAAEAALELPEETLKSLKDFSASELSVLFLVSDVKTGQKLKAFKSEKQKCPRCWLYRDLTGRGLCERCDTVTA